MTSALVVVCREGLVVRNEPPPASAIGIRSWSARCSPTGTFDSSQVFAARTADLATSSAGRPRSPKPVKTSGHMLGLDYQNYGVAWSHGVLKDLDATFIRAPLEFIANDVQFPLTDVFGEF